MQNPQPIKCQRSTALQINYLSYIQPLALSASVTLLVRFLLLINFLVVKNSPEEVKLKSAIVPVHILKIRIVDIVNPSQSDVIPRTDPKTDRALITQTGAPRKFRTICEILPRLILILTAAHIEVHFRTRLQVEPAREPNLSHHRYGDVGKVQLIVDVDVLIVVRCGRLDGPPRWYTRPPAQWRNDSPTRSS